MRKRHSGILLGRRSRSWINKDIETVFSVFHAMEPYIIVGSLLADFFQENLKYVKPGQPLEVSLNLYPGQIFTAKVEAIWKASGVGQMLPSGTLPGLEPVPPDQPQRQYAAKILFDSAEQSKFPIGAQGAAAIYTDGLKGSWAALRRICIRNYIWFSWLNPISF